MRINIIVKPNSKKNEIIKEDKILKVLIRKPAENNKANIELIKFLTKHYKKKIRIISGLNSRKKTIELE